VTKVINIQVLKNTLRTSQNWQVHNITVIFFFAHHYILTAMLEFKIAFKELDLITLIAIF